MKPFSGEVLNVQEFLRSGQAFGSLSFRLDELPTAAILSTTSR